MNAPYLKLTGIVKEFGPNRVLNNVDFEIERGEIVAIVGQNGAGKSTLMNVIAGVLQPTLGRIHLEGQEVRLDSPRAAAKLGIRMVHQELSLFPSLTIMENLLIGQLPRNRIGLLDRPLLREKSRLKMMNMGLNIDPSLTVAQISVAQQQMIEICREVDDDTKILILDEPTSAIGKEEVGSLFRFIRRLKSERAISFIYISHRLDEVLAIADRIYAIRDGVVVSRVSTAEMSHDKLIKVIVGEGRATQIMARDFSSSKSLTSESPIVLTLQDVSSEKLRNVTFSLRKGEVLGLAGLTGAGRTEILKTIYGATPRSAGVIRVGDVTFTPRHECRNSLRAGVCLIPEDRKDEGLNLGLSIRSNISLASLGRITNAAGLIDQNREAKIVADQTRRLQIKAAGDSQPVRLLSGGNQQKVCFAKWTVETPSVLLLDEPTKGVDIGAKEEIFRVIGTLTGSGVGIIVVSSEFPELLRICDRILVLRDGAVSKEVAVEGGLTEERLIYYATGGGDAPTSPPLQSH